MARKGGSKAGKRRTPSAKLKTAKIKQRRTKQSMRNAHRAARPMPRPKRTRPSASSAGRSRIPAAAPVPTTRRSAAPAPNPQDALMGRYQTLQNALGRLDRDADLGDVYDELGRIEEMFTMLPTQLDELRVRGYVHSGGLEDRLEMLDEDWDNSIRPNVERQLQTAVYRLDQQVNAVQDTVGRMAAMSLSTAMISNAENSLRTAESAVNTARNSVESLFQGVLTSLGEIKSKVHSAEWMIEHIEQSPEIELLPAEGPIMAVEAEWEENANDDGPDGVLLLTDQRLIFEQKEEVATKKFLFITRESETIQKVLIDVDIDFVEEVEADEESAGMLNMRKNDILELVFSGEADLSRARFHIRGNESADWAAMIKRVKNGDIDEDRAEEFFEEIEEAEAITAMMPENCPFCFAPLPTFTRGISSHTCEFCGNVVTAQVDESGEE